MKREVLFIQNYQHLSLSGKKIKQKNTILQQITRVLVV